MNKLTLVKLFNEAKEKRKAIAVWLSLPTRTKPEIIIVDNKNLQYKLNYYLTAYEENLRLKTCKDIKILNVKVFDLKKFKESLVKES